MIMKKNKTGFLYTLPQLLTLLILFFIPLVLIFSYSFMAKGLYGGVIHTFSLKAYSNLLRSGFLLIAFRTILISIVTTAIIIVIGLITAYAMARSKHQIALLIIIMIPFWTNSIIRIYAWLNILGAEGFLNTLLMKLHIINEPLILLYNIYSVILVLVYMNLPFAVLPLFTAIDSFDFSLLEASRDLGASKFKSMFKVLLPNIKSGIATAIIFTFIPIFGAYTVPLLVGGLDSYMLGNIIVDQVSRSRDWPTASAFSVIITLISTAGVLLMLSYAYKEKIINKEKELSRGES